jgi:hypothetical protein
VVVHEEETRWLEFFRKQYVEEGKRLAIIEAIRRCAIRKLPLPDWAAEAFVETRSALFDSWSAWATAAGEHVGTRSRFLDALEARGFEPARTAGRGFRGLRTIPKPTTHHWSDP